MQTRRSIRHFLPKPVAQAEIDLILEAARLAPTSCNHQQVYFIQVEEPTVKKALCEISGKNGPDQKQRQQKFVQKAATLLVVAVNPYGKKLERWQHIYEKSHPTYLLAAVRDAAIVAHQAMLRAVDLGLGTCYMSWFEQSDIKSILKIPDEHYVVSIICLGYPQPEAVKEEFEKQLRVYKNEFCEVVKDD